VTELIVGKPPVVSMTLTEFSCKGATTQRELEYGSRGIAIVGAVTRQLLVKILRAGTDLVCALVNCKLWKLATAPQLSVVTSRVLKWSINPISNPKPRRESLIHGEQTSWHRAFFEKLIVAMLVKKFSDFYATRKSIALSPAPSNWTRSWASLIQSTFLRFILYYLL
jgi:hypothetical protein